MENKPITRGINISGDSISKKIEVICKLMFEPVSKAENNTLLGLIFYGAGRSMFITPILAAQIKQEYELSDSAFSTAIYRLIKKRILKRDSKTIIIHPAFSGINEVTRLVITFQKQDDIVD